MPIYGLVKRFIGLRRDPVGYPATATPAACAALIEGLIASLDKPDPSLDAAWLKEADSRMAAYRSGELGAIDTEQVFSDSLVLLGRRYSALPNAALPVRNCSPTHRT